MLVKNKSRCSFLKNATSVAQGVKSKAAYYSALMAATSCMGSWLLARLCRGWCIMV